jgi:site-specific recombinase XerD
LATLRDLALFLDQERGKQDWSTVDVGEIEEFLNLQPNNRPRRLTVLSQFFRFARTHRLVLIDPTRSLERKQPKGFRGRTLTIDQQRLLFRRWTTDPVVHPHEALIRILALLHGASGRELRLLRCDSIDQQECSIRLTVVLTRCRWIPPVGRS